MTVKRDLRGEIRSNRILPRGEGEVIFPLCPEMTKRRPGEFTPVNGFVLETTDPGS